MESFIKLLNIDKIFIPIHAAPTCGKISPGNKGENTQHAERGRRVSQHKGLDNHHVHQFYWNFIISADRNNFLSNNMSQNLQVEHYFLLKSIFHLLLNFSNHFVLQKIFPIKDEFCSVPFARHLCLPPVLQSSLKVISEY